MTKTIHSIALLITASTALAQDQCGVYLAESSTDHVLGSFAGRTYARDEIIGSQDAIVQFVDIRANNQDLFEQDLNNLY